MATLGKRGFAERIRRGVEPELKPGERIVVSVYLRGSRGTIRRLAFGVLAETSIAAFIVSLTDQRLLVFAMGKLQAQNSTLLFAVPAEDAHLVRADLSGFQGELTLDLAEHGEHTLIVPRAWRDEANRLMASLQAP